VVDSLPAQETTLVRNNVASTNGLLTLHFLPGYAPDLNPDELVWSHKKRTGVAHPCEKAKNWPKKSKLNLPGSDDCRSLLDHSSKHHL
jgi:transposase